MDAYEIEAVLLRPGPHYLLAAFAQPEAARSADLEVAARMYRLDETLRTIGEISPPRDVTRKWLTLLTYCAERLIPSSTERAELQAIVFALGKVTHDTTKQKSESIWDFAAEYLNEFFPNFKIKRDTLRGRHWAQVRLHLAQAMARLQTDSATNLIIPRKPREPGTFTNHDLEAIHNKLIDARAGGLVVIDGEPGLGKSELALRYIEAYQEDLYDYVFWLRANDQFLLEQDFLAMATKLLGDTVNERNRDVAFLRRHAFQVLETTDRWLLVFDDVRDPAWLLPYLPRNPWGHGLCTFDPSKYSQTGTMPSGSTSPWSEYLKVDDHEGHLPAPDLERFTLTTYFNDFSPSKAALDRFFDQIRIRANQTTDEKRSRLAMMLAHRYLTNSEASLSQYLDLWYEEFKLWDDKLKHWDDEAAKRPRCTPGSIAASLLLKAMHEHRMLKTANTAEGAISAELEREALVLLGRLAEFEEQSIPARVLNHRDYTPATPLEDQRLHRLADLGLVDRNDLSPGTPSFEIHADVRNAVVMIQADDSDNARANPISSQSSEESRDLAAQTLLQFFPVTGGRPSTSDFEMLPHAEKIASNLTHHPVTAIELFARAAICHIRLGSPRAARACIAKISEKLKEKEQQNNIEAYLSGADEAWPDPDATRIMSSPPALRADERLWRTIELMRHAGYYEGAITLADELVQLIEATSLPKSSAGPAAHLWFEQALAYRDRGNYNKKDFTIARLSAEEAKKRWQDAGEERWTAAAEFLLAFLEFTRGNFDSSYEIQEKILARRKALFDRFPRDPDVLADLGRSCDLLGRTADARGQTGEAWEKYGDAVRWWAQAATYQQQRCAPPNHAMSLSRQALAQARLGRLEQARRHSTDALFEVEEANGLEHRNTAFVQCQHAEILRLSGQLHTAWETHRTAIERAARQLGRTHPMFAALQLSYAVTARGAGRLDEAFTAAMRTSEFWKNFQDRAEDNDRAAKLAHAQCWLELGQILLAYALTFPATTDAEPSVVHAAGDALGQAHVLFRAVLPDPEFSHPAVLECLIALAEVAFRHDPNDNVPAQRAVKALDYHVALHKGIIQPLISPASRLIAARIRQLTRVGALHGEISQERKSALDALQAELKGVQVARDVAPKVTPLDGLEVALAEVEMLVAASKLGTSVSSSSNPEKLSSELRKKVLDELTNIQKELDGKPHQAIARAYNTLGDLSDQEFSVRAKARNERERDRNRPLFKVEEHLATVEGLLRASQAD
jgi:tetratricopeptide (TPR) repeat protein